MLIIAVATSKGGSGKTTLTACLADYWSQAGKQVRCLDTDPNHNLSDQLQDTAIPCKAITEEEILDAAASAEGDILLIDVAGSLARGMLYAVSVADLVLIPCKTDRKDVVEAARTQDLIHQAEKLARRKIAHRAVLTQVNRRAVVTLHTRTQLDAMVIPTLTAEIPARTAYQQASYLGKPLADPSVREDILALALELEGVM